MQQTKEPQGKILFKRTDIRTMRKDIKMLREFDSKKEREKVLNPITINAKSSPLIQDKKESVEAQKQRLFALKSEAEKTAAELKKLDAQKESLFTQKKDQLSATQNNQEKILNTLTQKESIVHDDNQRESLEKKRWMAERNVAETKIQINDLETTNKESEAKKAEFERNIAQTNSAIDQANAIIKEKTVEQAENTPLKTLRKDEDEQRRKFMEDIEAWANSSDNKKP